MKKMFYFDMGSILDPLKRLPEWLDHQTALSPKERAQLKRMVKRVIKILMRLRKRSNVASSNELGSIQYKLLRSHSYVVVAILAVFQSAEPKAKKVGKKISLVVKSVQQLEALANTVKSRPKLSKPIAQWEEPKSDGSTRTLCSFDIVGQAQAQMAEWIFCACSFPNSFEYCKTGKGTHRAVARLPRHIKKGFRYWVALDLVGAYPSVRRGHLHETARVSKHVSDLLVFPVGNQTNKEAAQPSLPQGIASSPEILSAIVGQQLRQLDATNLVMMSYCDDILIGARTIGELTQAVETLKHGFENLSAGPLHFKLPKIVDLESGGIINFLGYAISVDSYSKDIWIRPNVMAFAKFRKELFSRLQCEYESTKSTEKFDDIASKYANDWRAGFPLWKSSPPVLDLFKTSVELMITDFINSNLHPTIALKVGHSTVSFELTAI